MKCAFQEKFKLLQTSKFQFCCLLDAILLTGIHRVQQQNTRLIRILLYREVYTCWKNEKLVSNLVLLTNCGPKRFLITKCGPYNVSVVPAYFVGIIYYNVVSYVHIPLVQERSEAERRAIWLCLNVATWRRERSDRAIQQIC